MGQPGQKGSVGEMGIPGKNSQMKHTKRVREKLRIMGAAVSIFRHVSEGLQLRMPPDNFSGKYLEN